MLDTNEKVIYEVLYRTYEEEHIKYENEKDEKIKNEIKKKIDDIFLCICIMKVRHYYDINN